jgi:hypothetical protein
VVSSTGFHHPEEGWIQIYKKEQVDGQPLKRGGIANKNGNSKTGATNAK